MKKKRWCNYYRIWINDDAKVVNFYNLLQDENQREIPVMHHTLSILSDPVWGGEGSGRISNLGQATEVDRDSHSACLDCERTRCCKAAMVSSVTIKGTIKKDHICRLGLDWN